MVSREIKFRGWDNENQNMLSWEELSEIEAHVLPFGTDIPMPIKIPLQDIMNDETFELSQFTGLHDKTGKEIYEGDILKHDLWGIAKVYWKDGSFWADNCKRGDDFVKIRLGDFQLQRTRVIGNIYQNPELLRGGENNDKTNKK